jgi:tetratricopeptide (TPR) repeat protein
MLELQKATLGADHELTLQAMNGLAWEYYLAGNPERGLPLAQDAVSQATAKFGRSHDGTLACLDTFACLLELGGRREEAIARFTEVWQLRAAGNRKDDPHPLYASNRLAIVNRQAGQLREAHALFDEMLQVHGATLQADHPAIITARLGLGETLLLENNYGAASRILQEVLDITKSDLPTDWGEYDDSSRFTTQSLLGAALAGQQNWEDAEPLLKSGYEGLRRNEDLLPIPVRFRVTQAAARLAQFYDATGQPGRATAIRAEAAAQRPVTTTTGTHE